MSTDRWRECIGNSRNRVMCLLGALSNLTGLLAGGVLLAIASKGPIAPIGGLHNPALIIGLTIVIIELYILYRTFRQESLKESYPKKEAYSNFSHPQDHSLAHRFASDPNSRETGVYQGSLFGLS